jgi:hypothetical protein
LKAAMMAIPQQLLVRFQDATHVITVDHPETKLLPMWSDRTGWPLESLEVSFAPPFCDIRVKSCIRGGKGGFGTLLKGQSRQAGAKLTTDFGACRDLQGRRLRHVNDEIKLRKWRDMQKRKQNGEEVKDDELWNTPTGLYNWHLMTPTWADISKKATYRIKRQFQQLDKAAQKQASLKKEQENALQESITHYVGHAASATESIQQSLPSAIQQGLLAAKNKKRKRAPIVEDDDKVNSLCTLSGDIVMDGLQLQSKSDFSTAVLVLDKEIPSSAESIYYEVTLVTGGLAQIGWATLVGDLTFTPNDLVGDGVGDDAASFAVDGSRQMKFHAGQETPFGEAWKAGDRLGCSYEPKKGNLKFSINGKDLGVAFTTAVSSLFPAMSCNQGEILELHTSKYTCKYTPTGALLIDELLMAPDEEKNDITVNENNVNEPKQSGTARPKKTSGDITKPPAMETRVPEPKPTVKPEPLDLEGFESATDLEKLGLDRLKAALMALQVKCG